MITLLATCLIIIIGSLVHNTFSNLKLLGTNFIKHFACACIFSFTITIYLIKFIGIKSLNTKECPAGLSPGIIPSHSLLPKLYLPFHQKTENVSGFD